MRKLLDFRRAPAAAGPIASDTALFGLVRLHLGGPGAGLPREAPIGAIPSPFVRSGPPALGVRCIPTNNLEFFSAESFEMNQARRKKEARHRCGPGPRCRRE